MDDLNGKSYLVTGGATGIGAATVRLLAARGANVAVNYSRSAASAEKIAEACKSRAGEVLTIRGDVADDAACRRMADELMSRWGRLDGLVNNAGITKFNDLDNLEGLDADDFHRLYSVNVVGAYQMIRAVAGHMKRAGAGAIVNVSSLAGITGAGSSAAYAASKGAMNTLTLSMARALAPQIRVNAICPSFVPTEFMTKGGMTQARWDVFDAGFRDKAALRRAGAPADIAASIMFLLAGDPNMTGQIIASDSGIMLA